MKLTENIKIPKPKLRCYFKGLNKQVKFIFGLTATDLRTLVYQLAEQYHLPHRFNKDKEIAGKKW
ncbi:tigger transposable element-derived protein 6-like [Schistosoma japonicum]|nr:tigger transposable element-derived protein 6-like [Schistosoma japonicum]